MSAVLDAALNLTRHYPGGAAALGARMGKTNLADEVNPNLPRSKLGLEDAVTMQLLAGDFRVLYAMATDLGHFPPVPMPDTGGADVPCLATVSKLAHEFGLLVGEVGKDLADGQVTNSELARVQKHWHALMMSGQQLMQQMTAMNAALQQLAPSAGAQA